MFDVYKIRSFFPMLKTKMHGKKIIFFDNAATTFKPIDVIKAINNYYLNQTSNSHRGDYDLCFNVDKVIDDTRQYVDKFDCF